MARKKKAPSRINVKGMSVEDILNLTWDEIENLTEQEMKQLTSRLVSVANKRLKRLGKSEIGKTSPAYISAQKRGGKFSVKGKNLNQVRSEFAEVSDFLGMKTSTTRGHNKYRKEVFDRIGISKKKITPYKEKKFWKTYRKLEERMGGAITSKGQRASDRIQKMLAEKMNEKGWNKNMDSVIDEMEKEIDRLYLEEQKQLQEMEDEDAFDFDEDDEDEE